MTTYRETDSVWLPLDWAPYLIPGAEPRRRRGREPAATRAIREAVAAWRAGYDPVSRRHNAALRLYALLPTRRERDGVTLAEYAAEVAE
jgi:hypothetical protein